MLGLRRARPSSACGGAGVWKPGLPPDAAKTVNFPTRARLSAIFRSALLHLTRRASGASRLDTLTLPEDAGRRRSVWKELGGGLLVGFSRAGSKRRTPDPLDLRRAGCRLCPGGPAPPPLAPPAPPPVAPEPSSQSTRRFHRRHSSRPSPHHRRPGRPPRRPPQAVAATGAAHAAADTGRRPRRSRRFRRRSGAGLGSSRIRAPLTAPVAASIDGARSFGGPVVGSIFPARRWSSRPWGRSRTRKAPGLLARGVPPASFPVPGVVPVAGRLPGRPGAFVNQGLRGRRARGSGVLPGSLPGA